jgi:Glycosyl transferase family 90
MLRRKKGQHSSVSPLQDTSNQASTSSQKEFLSLEGTTKPQLGHEMGSGASCTVATTNQRLSLSNNNINSNRCVSIVCVVGTFLSFCAACWSAFRRKHDPFNFLIPPPRVFSKWDGTVVDLMPSVRKYFHVSSLQSNFSAFQRIYIVHEDSLYVADVIPANRDDRMIAQRANLTEPILTKLARERKLRNGATYLVNYEDSRFCLDETLFHDTNDLPVRKVPILTLSRPIDCNYAFPMVTYETIRFASTSANATASLESPPPWMSRDKRVVWRGSPTGTVRIELGIFARNHTDLLDYQLTFFLITGKKGQEFLGPNDLQKYRAVLDVDGASWSSRFASLLCSASVVIKYDPKNVDYFHDELQPFVHYIPVTDTTDLLVQARFVQDDSNAAKIADIIRNANQWCHKRLELSEIELDMASILLDYSRYQDKIDTAKLMSTQSFTKVLSE